MTERNCKVIVFGVSGMLGHTLFTHLFNNKGYDVVGTVRNRSKLLLFPPELRESIHVGIDAEQFEAIERLVVKERPNILINCIGIIKQLPQAHEPIPCISINALLPHRLAALCHP